MSEKIVEIAEVIFCDIRHTLRPKSHSNPVFGKRDLD